MKKRKVGRRSLFPFAHRIKKYWVFAPEYREMNKYERDRKLALDASGDGRCWWIQEYFTMYPNRILDKSRKDIQK